MRQRLWTAPLFDQAVCQLVFSLRSATLFGHTTTFWISSIYSTLESNSEEVCLSSGPFWIGSLFCKYKSIHVRFTFTGFQWSMKPLLDSTKIIQILTFDLPEQKRSSYQACYFNKEVFLNKLIHPYINGGIYTHTHSRVHRQSTQWKRSKLLSLPFR